MRLYQATQYLSSHFLWAFPDATQVALGTNDQFPGTIVVPRTDATLTVSTSTNGRVLANGAVAYTGGAGIEHHNYPFAGPCEPVPVVTEPEPEPSPEVPTPGDTATTTPPPPPRPRCRGAGRACGGEHALPGGDARRERGPDAVGRAHRGGGAGERAGLDRRVRRRARRGGGAAARGGATLLVVVARRRAAS